MVHEFHGRTLRETVGKSVAHYRKFAMTVRQCDVATLEKKSRFDLWAPPLFWGPWLEIFASIGPIGPGRREAKLVKAISYDVLSDGQSSFDVEIIGGDQNERAVGPGSSVITISGEVSTALKIRAKSHSIGLVIRVSVS